MDELKKIETAARKEIAAAADPDALEKLRIQYLGRKEGALVAILRSLKNIPESERKKKGEAANALRQEIENLLGEKRRRIEENPCASLLKKERLDVTRPGFRKEKGHLHPMTKVTRDITAIFSAMGFETVEGPEVETEYYNFDALNIPPNHPARDMWDTFWLRQNEVKSQKSRPAGRDSPQADPLLAEKVKSNRLLLRTHTSPVQIRYMETHNLPIRIITTGRAYRYEATDAAHDYQFHQLEGLMAEGGISIANFKAIIQEFFSQFFKIKTTIRLRPSYFPFTEPSFEVDISCVICDERGCAVCKRAGWLEMGGAGMVHPNVFKAAGYNPKSVQGFAFGFGIERLAMMKYKIPDIRLFHSGDLRFLKQF